MKTGKNDMKSFYDTFTCQSEAHCHQCRARGTGHYWRKDVAALYKTDGGLDFHCPKGKEWHGSGDDKRFRPEFTEDRFASVKAGILELVGNSGWVHRMRDRLKWAESELKKQTGCSPCAYGIKQKLVNAWDVMTKRHKDEVNHG